MHEVEERNLVYLDNHLLFKREGPITGADIQSVCREYHAKFADNFSNGKYMVYRFERIRDA